MITKNHANELLNWEFRGNLFAQPQTHYIGLCTGVDETTGAITGEPTVAGYARKAVNADTINWGNASNAKISNIVQQDFAVFEGTGVACTHWFISRTSDGVADYYGKLLDTNNNEVSIPIMAGAQVWIAAGNISIEYANPS